MPWNVRIFFKSYIDSMTDNFNCKTICGIFMPSLSKKLFICFNRSAKGITTMYSSKIEQGNFADLLFFLLPFTLVDCGLVYAFSFSFEQEYFVCFDFVNIGIKSKLMKQPHLQLAGLQHFVWRIFVHV